MNRGLVWGVVLEPPVLEPPLLLPFLDMGVVAMNSGWLLGTLAIYFIIQKPETQKVGFFAKKIHEQIRVPMWYGIRHNQRQKYSYGKDTRPPPIAHTDPNGASAPHRGLPR